MSEAARESSPLARLARVLRALYGLVEPSDGGADEARALGAHVAFRRLAG